MDLQEPAANPADAETPVVPADAEANTPAVGDTETIETKAEESELDELNKLAGLDSSEAEAEAVEVEYEGKQYKLPPELKDAVLRQADYTRKTMELAETRKSIEAKQAEFEQQANRSQEEFHAHVTLTQLNATIGQYEQINWQEWMQTDLPAALAAKEERDQLVRQRDQIGFALNQHMATKNQQQSDEVATLRRQAFETVAKEIPAFTNTRRTELETTLETAFGAPKGIGAKITDPWEYKVLHYADIGRKFVERQREAAKAAKAVKPATMVGGSATAGTKSPDDMTPEEWAKHRQGK